MIWLLLQFLSSVSSACKRLLPLVIFCVYSSKTTFCHSLYATYSEKKFFPAIDFQPRCLLQDEASHYQHFTWHTQTGHIPQIFSVFDFQLRCLLQGRVCHVINNLSTKRITKLYSPANRGTLAFDMTHTHTHTHKKNYQTIQPPLDMQPAALMKPDLQRHSYSLIFLPRLRRHSPNPCPLWLRTDRALATAVDKAWYCNDSKKTKENTKFKKNSGLF